MGVYNERACNSLARVSAALEMRRVESTLYLVVMVGIISIITAIALPVLVLKRCVHCGKWSSVDASQCRQCGQPFGEKRE
jgi:hypothetical protein